MDKKRICIVCVIMVFSIMTGYLFEKESKEEISMEPDVVSSISMNRDQYLTVVANRNRIEDKEEFAKLLVKMCRENSFHTIKFSTDRGYATEIHMQVYLCEEDIEDANVDEHEELYVHEVNKTYIEYLMMCVDSACTDAEKWNKIIQHIKSYDVTIQNELVLVFCDTEKKPHEQYEDIKRKINEFHGVGNAADEVIMFGNPCTMQIISKHWTDENLKSPAKPVNAPLIKEYTGVENYKGRADQIREVMEHVTEENYVDMCQRVSNLESDDSVTGSSNFGKFIELFESGDSGWIEEINGTLEM